MPSTPPIPTAETRVVELRVPGIMGTTAADLVDAVAAVDVAGDTAGRIVRPADRLLRPAPGPVLRCDGRTVPRTVEGYQWSHMTSGGWSKALWALLFPFSLANLCYWMLPPIPEGSRAAHALGFTARAVLRLAALLLTVLLVSQLEVVSLHEFAFTCLRPDSGCLSVLPAWVHGSGALRSVAGLLPVGVAVLVLHRISTVKWQPNARLGAATTPVHQAPRLPGDNVAADPDTPALRALHLNGSLAVAALAALGDPSRPGTGAWLGCWIAALTLAAVSLVGALLLDDPSGGRPELGGRRLRRALGRTPRRMLVAIAVGLVVATTVLRTSAPDHPLGVNLTIEAIGALLAASCVLLGLLLIPAALLARGQWAPLPRRLRPWAGGWMAAPGLALACLLGGGFGAGLGIAASRLLGPAASLPKGYSYITLLWGLAAALAAAVTIALGCFALARRTLGGGRIAAEVGLLHRDDPDHAREADHAAWLARAERTHLHQIITVLAAALSTGAVISVVLLSVDITLPPWARTFSGIGVLALGALAVGLLRAVYLAARKPASARHLGGIADLASFWPREAHPVVPPCYALKVIPEVAARAAEHLRDPHTRVVLSAHSQGSLLVAVAAARMLETLDDAKLARLGMVTAGAPLQWAYLRAFPAVVSFDSLDALANALHGRWRSLCRLTDPLGGAVSTWDRQVYSGELLGIGFRPGKSPGPLAAAERSPHGALVLGGDHWLPDPQHGPVSGRRWTPGVRGHSDYTADPEWDRAMALAAGLVPDGQRSRIAPFRPGKRAERAHPN